MKYKEYERKNENKVQCLICPRKCNLSEGQTGFCKIRKNINGEINLLSYGYVSSIAIDPIEKKPLYHFYPTSKILSFGTYGCNMGCLFCQNDNISKQEMNYEKSVKLSPEDIVTIAKNNNLDSIAFTYNEPIIFYEYALDCAKLCKENGIKTVAVTAGYINEEPRKEFFNLMDAVNIDLKGFSKEFYAKNCFAKLETILETIKYVHNETNAVMELTTLLIEGENTDTDMLKREFDWITKELGTDVPIHLSSFHPAYKFMNYPRTSLETLIKARNIAKDFDMNYVYTGNIVDEISSATYCPRCKRKLITRHGYNTQNIGIEDNKCVFCGQEIYGNF